MLSPLRGRVVHELYNTLFCKQMNRFTKIIGFLFKGTAHHSKLYDPHWSSCENRKPRESTGQSPPPRGKLSIVVDQQNLADSVLCTTKSYYLNNYSFAIMLECTKFFLVPQHVVIPGTMRQSMCLQEET